MQRIIKYDIKSEILVRDFLKSHFSYRLIHRLSEGGKIFLNDNEVTVRARAKRGDTLKLVFEEKLTFNYPPQDLGIKMLYSDEDVAVVYKPAGVPSMPVAPHFDKNLFNGLAFVCPNVVFRVVTRLDKDTSGLVLLAKNAVAHSILHENMRNINKQYTALAVGKVVAPMKIDAPIFSSGEQKRTVDDRGKRAITEIISFKVLGENSLLTLELKTGRTHQIRVHLSYIGHPLVGDTLYGSDAVCEKNGGQSSGQHGGQSSGQHGEQHGGQMLVCSRLQFRHPITQKEICVCINGEADILQRIEKST